MLEEEEEVGACGKLLEDVVGAACGRLLESVVAAGVGRGEGIVVHESEWNELSLVQMP